MFDIDRLKRDVEYQHKVYEKLADDVKNHGKYELLFESRSNLLAMCDLVNELQIRFNRDTSNIDLDLRTIKLRVEINREIRYQEHILEGFIDRNDVVASRIVNETIDKVMEATQEWRT